MAAGRAVNYAYIAVVGLANGSLFEGDNHTGVVAYAELAGVSELLLISLIIARYNQRRNNTQ